MANEKDFHKGRLPFCVIDNVMVLPPNCHVNSTHVEWFQDMEIPFINTVRGYIIENHILLYVNDFEIPNIDTHFLAYLFIRYPELEWVGLGCVKGVIGDEWKPKFVIRKG